MKRATTRTTARRKRPRNGAGRTANSKRLRAHNRSDRKPVEYRPNNGRLIIKSGQRHTLDGATQKAKLFSSLDGRTCRLRHAGTGQIIMLDIL